MSENLKVTRYADGTEIAFITDDAQWGNLDDSVTNKAFCYYNNNTGGESEIYGVLYTWGAAMNGEKGGISNPNGVQGICPDGWHLPSNDEWQQLIDYIAADGHLGNEGTPLKTADGWHNEGNGTDAYCFSALPGGSRDDKSGSFSNPGYGSWWSSTENDSDDLSTHAFRWRLSYHESQITLRITPKSYGASVRCVKDN